MAIFIGDIFQATLNNFFVYATPLLCLVMPFLKIGPNYPSKFLNQYFCYFLTYIVIWAFMYPPKLDVMNNNAQLDNLVV